MVGGFFSILQYSNDGSYGSDDIGVGGGSQWAPVPMIRQTLPSTGHLMVSGVSFDLRITG